MNRLLAILVAVFVAASPLLATAAPRCCTATSREQSGATPDTAGCCCCCEHNTKASCGDADADNSCCSSAPHDPDTPKPTDDGHCDCPMQCCAVLKVTFDLPLNLGVAFERTPMTFEPAAPDLVRSPAHLDRLQRPPRPEPAF